MFQLILRGPWLYGDSACLLRCDGSKLFPQRPPTLLGLVARVVICTVIFDASYNFWHKWHHLSPPLYKHIHSIHHEYFSPFAWVTQYEHALELLAVSVFSIVIPVSLRCHPLTEWVWLVSAVQIAVDAHTGYDLGLLDKICPFWGGARHHENHHKNPRSNFQPFFTWFDSWNRTDFESVEAAKASSRAAKQAAVQAEKAG